MIFVNKKVSNLKVHTFALAGVAQWIERQPMNQRVTGSIPSQGTCLGCKPGLWWGMVVSGNHTLMFLSLSFSLPSPLSKNKINTIFNKIKNKWLETHYLEHHLSHTINYQNCEFSI